MVTNTSTDNEVEYVSSFKRSTAVSIDMIIVMFFRIVIAQILGSIWLNKSLENFITEFRDHFGTETIKNTPEHIDFIIHHTAFYQIILFYIIILLIGLIYHSYLNSSAWQATIGKRVMGIKIVKEDYSKINIGVGILHYILSILPILFMIYILMSMINNDLTFFRALTYSPLNIFLGFASIMWIQIHTFTKRKTTMYDLICKVVFIRGRTEAKLPWSKI